MSAIDRERWEKMTEEERYVCVCEFAARIAALEYAIEKQISIVLNVRAEQPIPPQLYKQFFTKEELMRIFA